MISNNLLYAQIQPQYIGAYTIPPSPDALSARGGSVNMDMSTGKVNLTIPLLIGGIKKNPIPISLSYNTGGIKVDDIATTVGLGWNLSAGGKITRIVRHYPDENGYCGSQGKEIQNISSWNYSNFENRYRNYDTEPDIFYFEIPNKSGMFIMDQNKVAHTIPYQKINIKWTSNGFVIIDNDGTIYTFGNNENTREITETLLRESKNETRTPNFISTWHLSTIRTIQNDLISFDYKIGSDYQFTTYNKKAIYELNWRNPNQEISNIVNLDSDIKIKSPKYIENIRWNDGRILFLYSGGREDITNYLKLSEIKLYSNYNSTIDGEVYLKSYVFNYSSFANKSLKLDKIVEQNGSAQILINKFDYFIDINLPARNSYNYDHWGYYNGKNNTTGIPIFQFNIGIQKGSDDRNVSFEHTRANSLKKIWNSNSGYRELEYELNQAIGYQNAGGLRIKSITTNATEIDQPQVTRYEYMSGNSTSGSLFETPKYSYMSDEATINNYKVEWYVVQSKPIRSIFDFNGANVTYSSVKEIYTNGSYSIYNYHTILDKKDENNKTYELSDFIDLNSNLGNKNFTQNSSKFWTRSLLNRLIRYDSNGDEKWRGEYTYEFDEAVKKEVLGFIPFYYYDAGIITRFELLGVYKWISQPIYLKSSIISGTDAYTVTETNTYNTDYMALVEQTTAVNSDIYKTKIKYPFSYNQKINNVGTTEINCIDSLMKYGIYAPPIEKITYKVINNANYIIGAELNTYKTDVNGDHSILPVSGKTKVLINSTPIANNNFIESSINNNGEFIHDSKYKTISNYDTYDNKLNLITKHDENNNYESIIYGYNSSLPIAIIKNAKADAVKTTFYSYSESIQMGGSIKYPLSVSVSRPMDFKISPSRLYWTDFKLVFYNRRNENIFESELFHYTDPDKIYSITISPEMEHFAIYMYDGSSLCVGAYCDLEVFEYEYLDEYEEINQVFHTSFEDETNALTLSRAKTGSKVFNGRNYTIDLKNFKTGIYSLTYWKSTDNGSNWQLVVQDVEHYTPNRGDITINNTTTPFLIDEVRLIPKNASIVTYTYIPGVGKTSETDTNGVTTYYEYDGFGRLLRVLDNNRNKIKEYEYFIK